MEKLRRNLESKLGRLLDKPVVEDMLYWEDLGVDSLIVDEAHEYKNLGFETSMGRITGLGDPKGSQKAFDLLIKIRSMRERHPQSRCAFLTGTPIANSVAEAYHMLRYLYPDGLAERGVDSIDAFVRSFAEISTDFEIDITGTRFQAKTRPAQLRQPGRVADHVPRGCGLRHQRGFGGHAPGGPRHPVADSRTGWRQAEDSRTGAVGVAGRSGRGSDPTHGGHQGRERRSQG